MQTILQQIRANSVAIISLMTAVIALSYNTWRNQTTEAQRNVRQAAFRVLENLGELQEVVNYRYYYFPFEQAQQREGELRLRGYGSASMARDLMYLMPPPAPAAGKNLFMHWNEQVNSLAELGSDGRHSAAAKTAEETLTDAIKQSRVAVIQLLEQLD